MNDGVLFLYPHRTSCSELITTRLDSLIVWLDGQWHRLVTAGSSFALQIMVGRVPHSIGWATTTILVFRSLKGPRMPKRVFAIMVGPSISVRVVGET